MQMMLRVTEIPQSLLTITKKEVMLSWNHIQMHDMYVAKLQILTHLFFVRVFFFFFFMASEPCNHSCYFFQGLLFGSINFQGAFNAIEDMEKEFNPTR